MISKSSIQAIKDLNAVEVVGHYVDLRKKGANYVGCCPFHNERTPSFVVNSIRNIFKCFGCGEGGDAIEFVMKHEGKSFLEALQIIAAFSNIHIESEQKIKHIINSAPIKKAKPVPEHDTIPQHIISSHLDQININGLSRQFVNLFGERVVREVFQWYRIDIDGDFISIPQIDANGFCRTAKIIAYGKDGKRKSVPRWLHNDLKNSGILPTDFQLLQAFTGEHLLAQSRHKKVAVVESQSTMLFMSCLGLAAEFFGIEHSRYFNSFTWLSTGGVNGVSWKDETVASVLKGRQVILFPDAGFYTNWQRDAGIMSEFGLDISVSDLLEVEYANGGLAYNADLRDYFLQFGNEITEKCYRASTEIEIKDMLPGSVIMKTGEEYGNLISASFWLKDGRFIDVLYDKDGELILNHPAIKPMQEFFNKKFIPGKVDGQDCLINIVDN